MTLQIIDASEVNGRTIAKGNNVIKGHHTIGPEKCCENCSWDISEEIRLRLRDTIKNFGEERVANAHRIGYACVNTSIGISTNSTCRLSNCNDSRLRGLIESNLAGMKAIIEWNIKKGIMLYRISSVVVPYASHDVNKLAWWDEYGYKIEEIGKIIKSSGMRVSMHPGQYVNINSPDESVVDFSIRELEYHAKFMDLLGLDDTHKMIIHIGGAYGDKNASMKRFVDVFDTLSGSIKSRLIIENDDKIYNVWDLLSISSKTSAPVVFDVLHHQINHIGKEEDKDLKLILERCFSTWSNGSVPKIHFATQRENAKYGTHADSVDINFLMEIYCDFINHNFDIMLETKDKEMSVLRAMRTLGLKNC